MCSYHRDSKLFGGDAASALCRAVHIRGQYERERPTGVLRHTCQNLKKLRSVLKQGCKASLRSTDGGTVEFTRVDGAIPVVLFGSVRVALF
ncbi:unnamed protein product [Ixodes pacificus]